MARTAATQRTTRKQMMLLAELYAAQNRRDNAAEQSGLLRAALDHAKVRYMNGENTWFDVNVAEQRYLNQKAYLNAVQERVDQLKAQVNA